MYELKKNWKGTDEKSDGARPSSYGGGGRKNYWAAVSTKVFQFIF